MAKKNEPKVAKFKWEKIKFTSVQWQKGRYTSKYDDLWRTLRGIRMNSAIKVTLDVPCKFIPTLARRVFKNEDYNLKPHLLDLGEYKIWIFAKISRKKEAEPKD
ncbi:hypothetical protein LCGC14_0544290 [marine sediment metagenome]|uniref:Uncharacterized protein n=1 Tax=marine sediment metagenome TaxID=412755 RepID=A0A0F9SA75_9ZZZZ